MARMGLMITNKQPNNHITGSTERITTDVVAGWIGIDLVERVTFDLNTAGTLLIDVEGRKYKLRHIRKSELYKTLRNFLCHSQHQMDSYLIK